MGDADRKTFMNHLKETRQALYEEEMVQWEKVMNEERALRLQLRKEQRKKDRKEEREKEKEEQRQRELDEKIKREKEEERRLAREAAEAAQAAAQEKKVDYFERAKRVQEIPILKQMYEEKKKNDAALWDKLEDERVANWKKEQTMMLQHKERLARMDADRKTFMNHLKETRQALYEEEMVQWEKVM